MEADSSESNGCGFHGFSPPGFTASPATTAADPLTIWIPVAVALIASVAAAVSAIIAAAAAIWVARQNRKDAERARTAAAAASRNQRSADYCRRQLDELYGEMMILRATSRRLWVRLHPPGSAFRLIDSISVIKKEPSRKRRRIVTQILSINERLAHLMEQHASLLEQLPPPESFLAFLDHQLALASLWDLGINVEKGQEPSFPRDFDKDIKQAVDSIRARLRELGEPAPEEPTP